MPAVPPEEPQRITAEEFLAGEPDALSSIFGDFEVVDGRVVRAMAQSEAHSRVVRRLASALEDARDPAGPCFGSDPTSRCDSPTPTTSRPIAD
ncbi:hypothetical protein [Nocardia neocaledoniensis]|uniref:hypothetical protein n=1 Tax=Nocardia neocaledoniensis TaxID=236511 RepID=UPI002455AD0F|nr:hypothetical protein [Nocardia neocaledoniensis]